MNIFSVSFHFYVSRNQKQVTKYTNTIWNISFILCKNKHSVKQFKINDIVRTFAVCTVQSHEKYNVIQEMKLVLRPADFLSQAKGSCSQ